MEHQKESRSAHSHWNSKNQKLRSFLSVMSYSIHYYWWGVEIGWLTPATISYFLFHRAWKREYGIVSDIISNTQFLRSAYSWYSINRDTDNHETGTVEEDIWYPDELQQPPAIWMKFSDDTSETDEGSRRKNKIRGRHQSVTTAVTVIEWCENWQYSSSSSGRYCRMKCIIRFRASSGTYAYGNFGRTKLFDLLIKNNPYYPPTLTGDK